MIQRDFRSLLMDGLRAFAKRGYISEADLQDWIAQLHAALDYELPTDAELRKDLQRTLDAIYRRDVTRLGVIRRVPGISRYTLERIAPHLRAELDRRLFAGVDLIRLNKRGATEKTLQRFAGWVSSVPQAGTVETNLRDVATEIIKPIRQLKYEARRVGIDQGHKLAAAVAHVAAKQEGAIAAIWHDRGEHDHGYDARPEHLKRSGKLFLIRESWAMDEGLVRKGALAYTDEIEQPAELPFCSCTYEYVTSPNSLAEAVLTAKGRAWINGTHLRAVS